MNVILFRFIKVSNKKGRKTASIRVAHVCKSFPFFLWLIPRSTEKIYETYFLSFNFHFNKEIDYSNSYKRRIISNYRYIRRHNTVFRLMESSPKILINQNKRYAITLINNNIRLFNVWEVNRSEYFPEVLGTARCVLLLEANSQGQ